MLDSIPEAHTASAEACVLSMPPNSILCKSEF